MPPPARQWKKDEERWTSEGCDWLSEAVANLDVVIFVEVNASGDVRLLEQPANLEGSTRKSQEAKETS